MEVTAKTNSKNEARNLSDDLIKRDISELEKAKGKGKNKRENILKILQNLELVFTGVYLHYNNASKTE